MWDTHERGAGPHPVSVVGPHHRGLGWGASSGHRSSRRRTCIWGKTRRYKAQAISNRNFTFGKSNFRAVSK